MASLPFVEEGVMLGFYVQSKLRRGQFRECPAGEYVEGFAGWLRSAGYKRRPGQLRLRGATHLGYWAAACGVPTERITEAVLGAFVRHLASCSCPHAFQGRDRSHQEGGQLFVKHLRAVGVVPSPPTPAVESLPPVLEQFSAWMRHHRGVRVSTLGNYLPLLHEFVVALGDDAAMYDAAGVRAFILARASRAGRGRAKSLVNAVRMFLRFLAVRGSCLADLAAAVPRIANWRLAALPRYLVADDIARLLATCEPGTAAGARDRAVMLLCVRLGLRAGDVRDLRLGDVDWSRGRLRVLGKGRCETWLPVPATSLALRRAAPRPTCGVRPRSSGPPKHRRRASGSAASAWCVGSPPTCVRRISCMTGSRGTCSPTGARARSPSSCRTASCSNCSPRPPSSGREPRCGP
jgi:hypothetical protein